MSYNQSRWRNVAGPIIRKVLAENAGKDDKTVHAALLTAYPFGPRKYHPYRIWLDEIARQTRRRPKLGAPLAAKKRPSNPDKRQASLFGDLP